MKKYKHRKVFTYNGKRYSVYADTLEELGRKHANKLHALQTSTLKKQNITVKEWAEECIETYKTRQSDITRRKYVARVEHCILSIIGHMCVGDVTPLHCQRLLNLQSGKSKTQINEVYQALKFIFSHAVYSDIITKDPTLALQKPKGTKKSRRALTPLEREAVLNVAPTDRRYYVFLLMMLCGCRPLEACEVMGSDLYENDGQPMLHIRGTKTANADRHVPIPEELWQVIKDIPKDEYVSVYSTGKKITADNRPRLWRYFWRSMNISVGSPMYRNKLIEPYTIPKDLTPYCLRHEFCSELARRKIDIRIAQRLMGHSDISLTANIYTHVSNDDIISALKSD